MTNTSWTVAIEENEQGEMVLPFDQEILDALGWQEGDILCWRNNNNGSWSITKKEKTNE